MPDPNDPARRARLRRAFSNLGLEVPEDLLEPEDSLVPRPVPVDVPLPEGWPSFRSIKEPKSVKLNRAYNELGLDPPAGKGFESNVAPTATEEEWALQTRGQDRLMELRSKLAGETGNPFMNVLDLMQGAGEISGSFLSNLPVSPVQFRPDTGQFKLGQDRDDFALWPFDPFTEQLGRHLAQPLSVRLPAEIATDVTNFLPLGYVGKLRRQIKGRQIQEPIVEAAAAAKPTAPAVELFPDMFPDIPEAAGIGPRSPSPLSSYPDMFEPPMTKYKEPYYVPQPADFLDTAVEPPIELPPKAKRRRRATVREPMTGAEPLDLQPTPETSLGVERVDIPGLPGGASNVSSVPLSTALEFHPDMFSQGEYARYQSLMSGIRIGLRKNPASPHIQMLLAEVEKMKQSALARAAAAGGTAGVAAVGTGLGLEADEDDDWLDGEGGAGLNAFMAGRLPAALWKGLRAMLPKSDAVPPAVVEPTGESLQVGEDVLQKLTAALGKSRRLRRELAPERSEELGRRRTNAEEILRTATGTPESQLRAARAAYGGPMPGRDFDPISNVLSDAEIQTLFARIKTVEGLTSEERVLRAPDALSKVLNTDDLLQPNEIDLLEEIFPALGPSLRRSQENNWAAAARMAVDVLNIPKALKATADFSAPLRQGFLLLSEVPQTVKALETMFKSGASEEAFVNYQAKLRLNPYYLHAKRDNLALLGTSSDLNLREEAFISRLLQHKFTARLAADELEKAAIRAVNVGLAPIRRLTRSSERAYVGFLNSMRLGVYENYARLWNVAPGDTKRTYEQAKEMAELARVINVFSGRGYLGETASGVVGTRSHRKRPSIGERMVPGLNLFLFSPRQVAARFEAPFMPAHAFGTKAPGQTGLVSRRVSRMAARNLVASFGATISLMTLIKASGVADVEVDPRSPDFGKARIGNTRLDMFAGFQQLARLMAQMYTAKHKTQTGEVVDKVRWDIALQFGLNKLSPTAGFVVGWLKTPVDDKPSEKESSSYYPTDAVGRLRQLLAPMSFDDLFDAVQEDGVIGGLLAAPAFFGAGVTTYKPRTSRGGQFDPNRIY